MTRNYSGTYNDPDMDDLTPEQKENISLMEMFDYALCELSHQTGDMPSEKEILDFLFKGNRAFKDVRRMEARLIELLDEEKARFWEQIKEAAGLGGLH